MVREFVRKYWRETLEAWRAGPSTKLHFFSQAAKTKKEANDVRA